MKALILSTATGGGHNTAAHAVMEALTERGVECRFEDCVAFGGQKLSAEGSSLSHEELFQMSLIIIEISAVSIFIDL